MRLETAISEMQAKPATENMSRLAAEADVRSVVIDSREARSGDVFFALSQPEYANNGFNGDFADSTTFVADALRAGAIAAVVRPDRFEEWKKELEPFRDRLIFSEDVIRALQRLAAAVYRQWDKPIVGITGSAGKTTAKEITSTILECAGKRILKNQKNYNNGIGHPLTVLRLIKEGPYDMAVLEMAMSTPMHEIARLCEITPPDIAVVLTVLPVHIEHLGTIEAIAAAKQEIVEGMKPNGTAILNADDFRVAAMEKAAKGEVITFGIEKDADIMASEIVGSGFGKTKFNLHLKGETIEVEFPLNGRHNVMNALAASAAAYKLGLDAKAIAEGLRHVKPPYQRGEVIYLNNNIIVVNDSYNSNPESLVKMAEMFCEAARDSKRKILVAGEMLELGNYAEQMHKQAGEKLGALPIDVLIGVRGNAKLICEAAQSHGIKQIEFTDDSKTAAELLTNLVEEGDAVLVKGSRGVQTEIVVERLVEKFGNKDPKTLSN